MIFRRMDAQAVTAPVGEVQPYENGTWIDQAKNVYDYDGQTYYKIGYLVNSLDEFSQGFVEVGLGLAVFDFLRPKRRDENDGLPWWVLFAFLWFFVIKYLVNQLTLFIYRLMSKHAAGKIAQWTEDKKRLRLFLPVTWFYDTTDEQVVINSMGALGFLVWLISLPIFIPIFGLLASSDSPVLAGLAVLLSVPLCLCYNIIRFFKNHRLAKKLQLNRF